MFYNHLRQFAPPGVFFKNFKKARPDPGHPVPIASSLAGWGDIERLSGGFRVLHRIY